MSVIPSYQKICILRLSAIGDVVHTISVVRAIQQQWPHAEITWVCGKFEYKLLHLIEGVRFVVFDKKRGFKEYIKLKNALKHEHFDVLLHMQVAARANIASLCIKADMKVGWDKARSRDFHRFFVNKNVKEEKQQHQVQGFLSFARALGVQADSPTWNLPVTKKAKEFVEKNIQTDKPMLIISACSSHKLRNWMSGRYAEFADYAITKYQMQVVLSGGPSDIEVEMADDIIRQMKNQPLNLVGKDTLEELLGLLSKASVVLSPDSGPAHIANAMGVPVIGLYACTWSKRSGPYNSLNYCVDKFEMAAKCFLHKSADDLFWGTKIEQPGVMELIEVGEVCQKLDQIMLCESTSAVPLK